MKLIWISDIHLNFLEEQHRVEFYDNLRDGDAIVISGDIAEGHNFDSMIKEMMVYTGKPVYFVLGNHDFYIDSVKNVKKRAKKLNWLSKKSIELSPETVLIGVDGWGDCRNGDYENSQLLMSDWLIIEELKSSYLKGMDELKVTLQKLADADARKLKRNVLKAVEHGYTNIIIVTHVPAFEEATLYAGLKSTPSGLPFFSSKCLGDAILPIAKKNPHIDFLWLSGHTHSRAKYKPCNNMTVRVAKAEYYYPQIERVIKC